MTSVHLANIIKTVHLIANIIELLDQLWIMKFDGRTSDIDQNCDSCSQIPLPPKSYAFLLGEEGKRERKEEVACFTTTRNVGIIYLGLPPTSSESLA